MSFLFSTSLAPAIDESERLSVGMRMQRLSLASSTDRGGGKLGRSSCREHHQTDGASLVRFVG